MVLYEIPKEIKNQLTEKFLIDFKNKTIDIFRDNEIKHGNNPSDNMNEHSREWWVELYMTCGMHEAMEASLKAHHLEDVFRHFKELDDDDRDSFNDEVTLLLFQTEIIK